MDTLRLECNQYFLTEQKYAVTRGTMGNFCNDLLNGTLTSFSQTGFVQNDADYVQKIAYYPVLITPFLESSATEINIKIGTVSSSHTGTSILETKTSVQIFSSTNAKATRTFNNFLDFEPYTTFTIYVPFFESIDIPAIDMYKGVNGYMSIDFTSGTATLYITTSTGQPLITRSCNIATEFPLGATNRQEQQRNNVLQLISLAGSIAGTVIGVASGNPLITAGSLGLGAKNVVQYLQNNVDKYSGRGGSGHKDAMACDKSIIIYKETVQNPKLPDAHLVGRPLNENKLLSTLSGFTKVGDIHFDPKGADIYNDEITEIITLLQNGVIL